MLNAVTVVNHLGETLRLELRYPEKSGMYIREITGLGPPKANISLTDIATADGAYFNSSRAESRNIVFKIGYLETPSVETNRHLSYKYFPIKRQITLVFETDERTAYIDGYVESNEPNIFSKQEETQISIVCPYPFFKAVNTSENGVVFANVTSLFEFPFSNESLTDPLLEFSSVTKYDEYNIPYHGDVDTGLTLRIHISGAVGDISIYELSTNQSMTLNVNKILADVTPGVLSGDEIIICTVQGEKSVKLLRNGVYHNILNCLDRNSGWFKLNKGDNIFSYSATLGAENLFFSATYDILYEGI